MSKYVRNSDKILVLSDVSLITYISSFMCIWFIDVRKFQNFFSATSFKIPEKESRQQNTIQCYVSAYLHYSTNNTRMHSYVSCPHILNQKAENLSNADFFYTGIFLHC